MEELTVEQRTQAVIDFNKFMDSIPAQLPHLTEAQKQELADYIADKRAELGL